MRNNRLATLISRLQNGRGQEQSPHSRRLSVGLSEMSDAQCKQIWKVGRRKSVNEQMMLPVKHISDWQMARNQLSQRSYQYPKNFRGIKIPSIGRAFSKYEEKDREGHLFFHYESQLPKIRAAKESVLGQKFKCTRSAIGKYFGYEKK